MAENAFAEAADVLGKVQTLVLEGDELRKEFGRLGDDLSAKVAAVETALSDHKVELERLGSEARDLSDSVRALHGEYLSARTELLDTSRNLDERASALETEIRSVKKLLSFVLALTGLVLVAVVVLRFLQI